MNYVHAEQLIVGGGIIGLCTAYYLVEKGCNVTIIDKGPKIEAASHGNCGLISPSHALPLNDLHLMKKALVWILKSNSPFYIKPRLDPSLLKWFVNFTLKTNNTQIHKSMIGRYQLMESSKKLYQEMFIKHNIDCGWKEEGILFVCKKESTFNHMAKNIGYTKREIGLNAKSFVGSELIKKEPAIKEDIYGGWLYEMDGHLKPDKLISELTQILIDKGVKFLNDIEVQKIDTTNDKVLGVSLENHRIKSDNLIICSGALSPKLLKTLEINIPIVPGKGYSITMDSPVGAPKIPCILQERKTVATPWGNKGYRLGGTMEFSGYQKGLNRRRLEALKTSSEEYLINPYNNNIIEEWWGWRSMTPDGLPIISRSRKYSNLILGCGHNMLGMSMGSATGKLISEIIIGQRLHLDSSFYSIERF
ncbi:NAD(P)/FAD-dependent oxidoreductase [Wocania ichthyoenteri]|uniref:NAD(P)/FAD-dependent oxidoreductase n=1 Tax=Wocania ichthyoenteri TaxID=1230531 RepID=UPI00053DB76A|nr:FAD-dependent oxidoreductase [Wocania ichthyoenteri]